MKAASVRSLLVLSISAALLVGPLAANAAPSDGALVAQADVDLEQRNAELVEENRALKAALAEEKAKNAELERTVREQWQKAEAYRRQVRELTDELKRMKVQMTTEFGSWGYSTASTYGISDGLMGSGLAGRGRLDDVRPVFAHKTMPFGTRVQFTYQGRTYIGECQDRGPYIAGREFDLGPKLARELGFGGVGTVKWRTVRRKKE